MNSLKAYLKPAIKSILYPLYERRLFANLDFTKTPHHIGVILDGNRRWSKANPAADGDTSTSRGHKAGAEKIIELLDWCEESKVEVLTIWLLSNQNLSRPPAELEPLLAIIADTVNDLASRRRWEIRPVGSMELLPKKLVDQLTQVASKTKGITGVVINVAIGYGGRSEIADAVKSIITSPANVDKSAAEIASSINVDEIGRHLYTAGLPDPDLVIRTSGEQRLGGFLLWQSAHSEFYFCEAYWPDFRRVDFLRALRAYSQRNRRFGK
ncbi:MAG: isoprenyl transferase [Actinomycetes bacterium]